MLPFYAGAAVFALNLFGYNFEMVLALARVLVITGIIVLTLRIPFKRKYHWMFLVMNVVLLAYVVAVVYFEASPDGSTLLDRAWTVFVPHTRLQSLVIFQFVVYFVGRKVDRWIKLVLAAGYAYVVATVWIPIVFDPSFVFAPSAIQDRFGWITGRGTSDAFLRPEGIDVFITAMGVLTFYLLFRYYRHEKSPLVRGQTRYLIVGLVFVIAGAYAYTIARYSGEPNLQNFVAAVGDVILLLGLRKKGFYSVTPVVETARPSRVMRLSPEEGRCYLARDAEVALQSFAELVKNGRNGFCITRSSPQFVRTKYGLQTTPIRWLADERDPDAIEPGDLLGLSLTIKDFMQKATKPVVILHGLEYLVSRNGFGPILRLVEGLNDANVKSNGILLLPLVAESLEKKDEALLLAETTPLPSVDREVA